MAGVLDLMGYVQQQGQLGEAKGKQNRLASLSQQAYGARGADRQSLIGQMVGTDPTAGMAMGDKLQSQDDARAKKAAGAARYVLQAVETKNPAMVQGAYQTVRPFLEEMGRESGKVPPPEWSDDMLPMLHQVLAAGEGSEGNGNNIQSTYVNAQGQRVGIRRDGTQITLGDANQSIRVLEQEGALPYGVVTSGGVAGQVVPLGGGQPAPIAAPTQAPAPNAPSGAQTVMGGAYDSSVPTPETFAGIATQFPGVQLTSTRRTPEHNAKVGGVPNSQHLAGTAGDFVVPQAQKAAFIAAMAARNPPLQAIDEGDHIHVQQPHGAQAAGQQAGGPVRTPTAGEKARDVALGTISAGMTPAQAADNRIAEQRLALANRTADRADATQARADAVAAVKSPQAQNAAALRVYKVGMKGLMDALAGTETGPLIGRLPALTTGQQVAEGGVAAMAPVLKQMFRSAGEGVFTDKDQEMLIKMIPTRTDTPEARKVKMQNIDNIVEAKLGVSAGAASGGQAVQRATNPQTGEVLELRNGQWVPAR